MEGGAKTQFTRCSHEHKEEVLFQHFSSHFSSPGPRDYSLNWEEISLQNDDLAHLEEEFTEDELLASPGD
jgi:hypothetical protein